MVRRPYAATAALALALTAAGCGNDAPAEEPEASSTPPTSAASSPSPTDEPTEKALGPLQTVRAWVKAYNRTVDTGDPMDVRELTAAACETCENLLAPVLETHSNGGSYDDPGWKVIDVSRDRDWPDSRTVAAAIRFPAGQVTKSSGAKPKSYPAEDHIISFELQGGDSEWRISEIVFLE
ncbi:hypothetical protein KUV85_06860 [Nocardioides panacisoli]|uniref:DUF6318 family protein n=1 Tax=Nocardioides panacisoli TaxID=627624 RepID=UPI001C631394|nr:DUF6318 family protein [Nocardioides panacisoli]QYJ05394.1 hypothetical protein KUV85_06860 [Nocardioides panacisoli]